MELENQILMIDQDNRYKSVYNPDFGARGWEEIS